MLGLNSATERRPSKKSGYKKRAFFRFCMSLVKWTAILLSLISKAVEVLAKLRDLM